MKRLTIWLVLAICVCDAVQYGPLQSVSWFQTTGLEFRLSMSGYGMNATDTIRILQSGTSCTGNSGDPTSVEGSLQYNCPDIDGGCKNIVSYPSIDILVSTVAWNCLSFDEENVCDSTQSLITSVSVDGVSGTVTMTFSNPHTLLIGDYIYLDSGVDCGANCVSSQLNLLVGGVADSSSLTFFIGNVVASVPSSTTVTVTISEFASLLPSPEFTTSGGIQWHKTNQISTRAELKGLLDRSDLVVCWNGRGLANGYTTEVGELTISSAISSFLKIGIFPTTTDPYVSYSPVVLTFTTSSFPSFNESSELILFVTNPSVFSILNFDGSPLLSSLSYSQSVCGLIFIEQWGNNFQLGFPFPTGCYVKRSFTGGGSPVQDEIHLRFDKTNGLLPNSSYQLVVNAAVAANDIKSKINSDSCCDTGTCYSAVYSSDARFCRYVVMWVVPQAESQPYTSSDVAKFEFLTNIAVPFTRTASDPLLSSFTLAPAPGGVVDLDNVYNGPGGLSELIFTLSGGTVSGVNPISASNWVRITFYPLTEWRLGQATDSDDTSPIACPPNVSFTVTDTGNGNAVVEQGDIIFCVLEGVSPWSSANMIRLQLPSTLVSQVSGALALSVTVAGLGLPLSGMFGSAVAAEVSDPSDSHFSYLVSTTVFRKIPRASRTVAQIVMSDDFYFSNTAGVPVNIQFSPGTIVPGGSGILFTLPTGFSCVGVTAPSDVPPAALQPHMGFLLDATWSFAANTCAALLTDHNTLYPLTFLQIRLIVDTPSVPSPSAPWTLSVLSGGTSSLFTGIFFASPSLAPRIVSAFPVYGRITDASSDPYLLEGGAISRYAIFFTVEQDTNSGVFTMTFPSNTVLLGACAAGDLQDYVYATADYEYLVVSRLPGVGDVTCDPSGDNASMSISFSGSLSGGSTYAFWISGMVLPQTPPLTPWTINTAADAGSFSGYLSSFPVCVEMALPLFNPGSMNPGTSAVVTLNAAIQSAVPGPLFATIIAPKGYVVDRLGLSAWLALGPQPADLNAVLLSFPAGLTVGDFIFDVPVALPVRQTSPGLNQWRVEFRLGDGTPVLLALTVDTPSRIKSLMNAKISPISSAVGVTELVRFEIETFTNPVTPSDPVVQIGFGVSAANPATPAQCLYVVDSEFSSLVPVDCSYDPTSLVLTVLSSPGMGSASVSVNSSGGSIFRFYVEMVNPTTPVEVIEMPATPPCGASDCVSFSNSGDAPLSIPGYSVGGNLIGGFSAGIDVSVRNPLKDNRPGSRNSLLMYFDVPVGAQVASVTIRAPPKFVFDFNCSMSVFADPAQVVGAGNSWPAGLYALWPISSVGIANCVGLESGIEIALSGSTLGTADLPYLIRLGIASNPKVPVNPLVNKWGIDLLNSIGQLVGSSAAIDSFELWTFRDVELIAPVIGFSQRSPITISFSPQSTIPGSGVIRITTPGFVFDIANSCANLSVTESFSDGFQVTQNEFALNATGCRVIDLNVLEIEIPKSASLKGAENLFKYVYTITTSVENPSEPAFILIGANEWKMQSFQSTLLDLPGDESVIDGYTLVEPLTAVKLSNYNIGAGLKSPAALVSFSIDQFSVLTTANGAIRMEVSAPDGFALNCTFVQYLDYGSNAVAIPGTSASGNHVSIPLPSDISDWLINNQVAQFVFDLVNPDTTPSPLNYWWVAIYDKVTGLPLASGSTKGFEIVPSITDVQVSLDGPNRSVSTLSAVTVNFTAPAESNKLFVEFIPSLGFDTRGVVVYATVKIADVTNALDFDLVAISSGGDGEFNGIQLSVASEPFFVPSLSELSIHLSNLLMGSTPGTVKLNLHSFMDSNPSGLALNVYALLLGVNLHITATSISTVEQNYALVNASGSTDIGAEYLWPRTDDLATIQFGFHIDKTIEPNDEFSIHSGWYQFSGLDPSLVLLSMATAQSGIIQPDEPVYGPYDPVSLINVDMTPNSVHFSTLAEISAGSQLLLTFPSIIPPEPIQSLSNFSLNVYQPGSRYSGPFPLLTNNNATLGFKVTDLVAFELFTESGSAPPSARVPLYVRVSDVGSLPVFSFVLVAPLGFAFEDNCEFVTSTETTHTSFSGPANASAVSTLTDVYGSSYECGPGPTFSSSRNSVYLNFTNSGFSLDSDLNSTNNVIPLMMLTPLQAPALNNWFAISYGLSNTQLGWGLLESPFEIINMSDVSIFYSPLLAVRTLIAVTFTTKLRIKRGGVIRLYYPEEIAFDCQYGFNRITLPFYETSSTSLCSLNLDPTTTVNSTTVKLNMKSMDITFQQDLLPGTFSYGVSAITPSDPVNPASFSLVLLDSDSNVIDSVFNIPSVPFGAPSVNPTFQITLADNPIYWNPAAVIASSEMQIQFQFKVNHEGTNGIEAILLTMPEGFQNAISVTNSTKMLNSTSTSATIAGIPVTGVDISTPNAILAIVDTTGQSIAAATYQLGFPVVVPARVPQINIWHLSFCFDKTKCTSPTDDGVIVSLPAPGFAIGQQRVTTLVAASKQGTQGVTNPAGSLVLASLILLCEFVYRY